MITDKEYPATHSMSTAWFAIDSDGNVAVIDFNENGPVPQGIPETDCEYVITDDMAEASMPFKKINLTIDQAQEVLKRLEPAKISDRGLFEQIVKINPDYYLMFERAIVEQIKREKEFLKEKMDECELPTCWNQELGIYSIDYFSLDEDLANELIEKGVIEAVGSVSICNVDKYDRENKKTVFEHQFDHLPFFLYQQPYEPEEMLHRTYVPRFPFKAKQLSEEKRNSALKLDFSFESTLAFQIAEYYPYEIHSGEEWFVCSETEEEYIDEYTIPCRYVSNRCGDCKSDSGSHGYSRSFHAIQKVDEPTLVAISYCNQNPTELYGFDNLLKRIVILPIIYCYTFDNDNVTHCEWKQEFSISKVKKNFDSCKVYLEKNLAFLKPYALLCDERSLEILKEHYEVNEGVIKIEGICYPVFFLSEVESRRQELEALAELPYRGEVKNRIGKKRPIRND